MRGITTDSGDPRSETRISLFQDGVSISRSRASVVELFDLERIEVLKGPQGTLFGRGAEIGAISIIQNKARNESSGTLTAALAAPRRATSASKALPRSSSRASGRWSASSRRLRTRAPCSKELSPPPEVVGRPCSDHMFARALNDCRNQSNAVSRRR